MQFYQINGHLHVGGKLWMTVEKWLKDDCSKYTEPLKLQFPFTQATKKYDSNAQILSHLFRFLLILCCVKAKYEKRKLLHVVQRYLWQQPTHFTFQMCNYFVTHYTQVELDCMTLF